MVVEGQHHPTLLYLPMHNCPPWLRSMPTNSSYERRRRPRGKRHLLSAGRVPQERGQRFVLKGKRQRQRKGQVGSEVGVRRTSLQQYQVTGSCTMRQDGRFDEALLQIHMQV